MPSRNQARPGVSGGQLAPLKEQTHHQRRKTVRPDDYVPHIEDAIALLKALGLWKPQPPDGPGYIRPGAVGLEGPGPWPWIAAQPALSYLTALVALADVAARLPDGLALQQAVAASIADGVDEFCGTRPPRTRPWPLVLQLAACSETLPPSGLQARFAGLAGQLVNRLLQADQQ